MAEQPLNIYQKLVEVRKAVPYLKKENPSYQFNYVSSSQVLGNLKCRMDELGVLLMPSVTSHVVQEKATAKGGKEFFTELEMEFIWVNAENPEQQIKCSWYGQGIDTGEKGVGKALTYAEKYFMLKFFNIPTDKDDPDSFQEKVGNKSANSKSGKQNQQQGQQPTNFDAAKAQKTIFAIFNDIAKAEQVPVKTVQDIGKQKIYKIFNIDSLTKLTADDWGKILAGVENLKINTIRAVHKLKNESHDTSALGGK
jgi:hypothetical protein